ncbi:MAG: hypothetical protein Q9216_002977 [Gyalolechia sp. 2 TL-2023]
MHVDDELRLQSGTKRIEMMKLSNVLLPLLGLASISAAALAPADRQVLVTYPEDTPPSILQEAKDAIVAAVSASTGYFRVSTVDTVGQGGKITQEFSLIKSFAATVSDEVLNTVTTLSQSHKPFVEDDGIVSTQQQEPLEQ